MEYNDALQLTRLWKEINYCRCFTDNYIRGLYNSAEGILAALENREPVYEEIAPYAEGLIYELKMESIIPLEEAKDE